MKAEIRKYLAEIGRKGGKAGRGKSKALTSEQARANVMKRWKRVRANAAAKPAGAKAQKRRINP